MRTAFSISRARAFACAFVTSACSWTASRSWRPMVCTGFSEVIGSWKIIEIRLPRYRRSSSFGIESRSSPSNTASPLMSILRPEFRPMIVRQVTLLPEPDSPTIASVLPFSTENDTPSTARTMPSSVWKCVRRSLTSRSANSAQPDPRVDPGVQDVDQEVERDHHDRCEHDRPDDHGQVEGSHGGHGQLAEPGQAEHVLDQHRA